MFEELLNNVRMVFKDKLLNIFFLISKSFNDMIVFNEWLELKSIHGQILFLFIDPYDGLAQYIVLYPTILGNENNYEFIFRSNLFKSGHTL